MSFRELDNLPPENAMPESDAPLAEKTPNLKPAGFDPFAPGAGGWTPAKVTNLVASCLGGAATAAGAVLMQFDPSKGVPINAYFIGGAALVGCASGALGYLGLKSAGTRKLE